MRPVGAVVVGLAAALGAPAVASAQAPQDDRSVVLAVADSALAAISRNDFIAFTDLMLDSAVTFSAGVRDGRAWTSFRTRAQERAARSDRAYTERGFNPTVLVSGPIAMVWMPYDFHLNGAWSHCGVDVFTLLKGPAGWRIAMLGWSIEQPPACQPHPEGPAGK